MYLQQWLVRLDKLLDALFMQVSVCALRTITPREVVATATPDLSSALQMWCPSAVATPSTGSFRLGIGSSSFAKWRPAAHCWHTGEVIATGLRKAIWVTIEWQGVGWQRSWGPRAQLRSHACPADGSWQNSLQYWNCLTLKEFALD